MYNLTDSFLQFLYSIVTHHGMALSFALVSCEDSALFFQSHFISVHFGAGFILSVLQCKNSRWRVEFLHAFKPLYPCYQLSQLHLQGLVIQDLFFLLELLWMLPSVPADSTALKSVSGFPDILQCTKTSLPLVLCVTLLYLVCFLQGYETENKSRTPDTCLLHLPTFSNGSGCAEKAHGDQYWEHSCAGTGWRCWCL